MCKGIYIRICILALLVVAVTLAKAASVATEPPGLIIEAVSVNSQAEKVGLKAGDRLLSYEDRALTSPDALLAAQQNIVGKKAVVIRVRRGEETLTLTMPGGMLEIILRPDLPPRALALYTKGRTAEKAHRTDKAILKWKQAATLAREKGYNAAARWLYWRVGRVYEGQEKWKEAQEAYLTGWKLLEGSGDAAAQARVLEGLGRCSQNLKDYAAAERWFVQALQVNTAAGNEIWAADDATSLGTLSWSRRNLKATQDFSRRALEIRERLAPDSLGVATNLNHLGNVAVSRGDLQAAQDFYLKSLKIREWLAPDSLDVANSFTNLGNVARLRGDLKTAQNYNRSALAIQERVAPDSVDLARSLNNSGNVAALSGDLQAAQDYYRRALKIFERQDPNSIDVAGGFGNLGNVALFRNDLEAAQDLYSKALKIFEQHDPDSLYVATIINNMGNVKAFGGDLEAAQDLYSKALKTRVRLAPDSLDVAATLTNLGHLARSRGDLSAAQDYYRRALAIKEKRAPNSLDVSSTLNGFGDVARSSGDSQAAQDFYLKSLEIRERLAPNSLYVASSLNSLGYIALDAGRLSEALNRFTRAVEIVEAQRSKIFSPDRRALLSQEHNNKYTGLLRTQLALGDRDSAFATVERSRSRSLAELLTERSIDFRADAPAALLQQQEELNRDRSSSYYALQTYSLKLSAAQTELENLGDNKSSQQAEQLEERIDDFEEQIDIQKKQLAIYSIKQRELDASIRETSPKYASLKYPKPLDLRESQAALDPGTLLLSYFVSDTQTYLFALTKSDIKVFTLQVGDRELNNQVQEFLDEVATNWPDIDSAWRLRRATAAGARLYDLLVRPAQRDVEGATRVLVCPDGVLHLLPFAALVSRAEPGPRYLIEDKPLHTIVSMTVYAGTPKLTSTDPHAEPMQVLAFGDPVYSKRQRGQAAARTQMSRQTARIGGKKKAAVDGDAEAAELQRRGLILDPLPGTREEVLEIRKLFGRWATVKLGEQATEATAKQVGKDYAILHFGTHGLLDKQNGLDSAIVLSQPEALGRRATKEDNGYLQAWEIFEQLKLKAELVVLSACKTGAGQKIGGEGLIGLTRAFQYAGARSMVVSLWEVSDESTAVLMTEFYREIGKGASKDVALQRAMAAVRDSRVKPGWRHPYYWVPFVLIGDWNNE